MRPIKNTANDRLCEKKMYKKVLNSHFRNIHVAICVSRKPDEKKKSPKKEKDVETKVSPKKSPKGSGDKEAPKTPKVNPFAAMMGKSPATSSPSSSSSSQSYEEIVKRSRYDPIEDAIWKRGEKTPYLAFAKTLQAIEATSGRLKTIEILANYFR